MNHKVMIDGQVLVSMRGFGMASCSEEQRHNPHAPDILRPQALRGQTPKLDPATALAASAAIRLRMEIASGVAGERIGIVLASRYGNRHLASQFAGKVRRGQSSPSLYAASGYNICAGLAALAAGTNGPTLVLAGNGSNLADVLMTSSFYLQRGDADVMFAGVTETTADGNEGLCVLFALSREGSFSHPAEAAVGQYVIERARLNGSNGDAAGAARGEAPERQATAAALGEELAQLQEAVLAYAQLSGDGWTSQLQHAAGQSGHQGAPSGELLRCVGSLGQTAVIGRRERSQ
ncbi:hypothetical protein PaecuDRAFT_1974 [Paenibacillus curdlanolyticus YK9]|uniref:Beta-ketoacyl synthase N-terminal domain-containing protein n=1 Tax=Paenibacillus curdlanolyticus YK9 TaxID=717606 RepID=E0I8M1_9BACL|nr:hypothetical protein [Paenibacillus curdlanolyticus]EFM11526.1 hypothetical protein PaecuDRAFT_1974 [Paenibacillus curdlanolyticus YK9]